MSIKSLLAQKRTKVILVFLYFIIALVLLLLTWMQKIAVGFFVGYCFCWIGYLLMKLVRNKENKGATH